VTFLIVQAACFVRGFTHLGRGQMFRTTLKYVLLLVGVHLLLGFILIVTEATHGLSDMDASFLIVLLVYYMNLPTVWMLNSLGVAFRWITVVLAGIFQWSILAFAMSAVHHAIVHVRAKTHDKNP